MTSTPSIIKWSGSKRHVASELASMFPADISHIYEPFVGGGSMLAVYPDVPVFASDIICPLIGIWNRIKDSPDELLNNYAVHADNLHRMGSSYYYEVRNRFNALQNPDDFFFLLRTCYNGLPRWNKQGKFNTAFHLTRQGIKVENLRAVFNDWLPFMLKISFNCQDYEEALINAQAGDFVFLDPPYFGTNGQYQFGDFDHKRFYKVLERLNHVGAKWMLTLDYKLPDSLEPPDLWKSRWTTSAFNSSFSRLKGDKKVYVGDTVFTNYEVVR